MNKQNITGAPTTQRNAIKKSTLPKNDCMTRNFCIRDNWPLFFEQREYCRMIDQFLLPQLQLFLGCNNFKTVQLHTQLVTQINKRVWRHTLASLLARHHAIWLFVVDTWSQKFTTTILDLFRPCKRISAVYLPPLNQSNQRNERHLNNYVSKNKIRSITYFRISVTTDLFHWHL